MKKKFVAIAAVMLPLFFAVAEAPAATVVKGTWADTKDGYHIVISGEPATLKATVATDAATPYYQWVYGDNTQDAIRTAVATPYVVEAKKTYTNTGTSNNKYFTATLRVYSAATGGSLLGSDTYKVQVINPAPSVTSAASLLDFRKKVALDDGLWYIHKHMVRDVTQVANQTPQPRGWVAQEGSSIDGWDTALATMISGVSFAENGFKATGNAANPYTEDCVRLVNFVTERLMILPIGPKNEGLGPILNPENRTGTMIDGKGVCFKSISESEYEYGIAVRFLANSGYTTQKPLAYDTALDYTVGKTASLGSWTYAQIVQQLIDFLSWSQLYGYGNIYGERGDYCSNTDPATGACIEWTVQDCLATNPETGECTDLRTTVSTSPMFKDPYRPVPSNRRGSWPYWTEGWWSSTDPRGTYGDTSLGYWTVTGLKAAQKMGAYWPTFVKTEMSSFLTANQELADATYMGEFHYGEGYGHHMLERAGHGLTLLKWAGKSNTDNQVVQVKNFINKFWTRNNYQNHGGWASSIRGDNQCTVDGKPGSPADDCFSHYALNYNEAGHYECTETVACGWVCEDWMVDYYTQWGCVITFPGECSYAGCITSGMCVPGYENQCVASQWVTDYYYDDLNVFAMLTITEGLQAAGITSGFPTTDPVDYRTRYLTLLINNQMDNGGWDDTGWIQSSPFGAAWATIILSKF